MAEVYVRFEHGQEGRVSKEYGPYPFAQLTYDELRVGPDGNELSHRAEDGYWYHRSPPAKPGAPFMLSYWSDVIIYSK